MGPDFGKDKRADVVKLLREAVARGAELIQQQGDAGLDATTKYEWGNRMVRHSYIWTVGSLWCITELMEWCRRIRGGGSESGKTTRTSAEYSGAQEASQPRV